MLDLLPLSVRLLLQPLGLLQLALRQLLCLHTHTACFDCLSVYCLRVLLGGILDCSTIQYNFADQNQGVFGFVL